MSGAIDIRDYSKTAAQKGWGVGWPSCGGAKGAGTAVVIAERSGTRMSVHKRVARLVDLLIDETERRGYLLKPGQCGGYNCRPISGTSVSSNHAWGLAVDLNWNDNTYNSLGRFTLPIAIARMWNNYGFAWGGDYSGAKKDYMHLEFMGAPADADGMTAQAIRDFTGPAKLPVPPLSTVKPSPTPRPTTPPPTRRSREDALMSDLPLTVRADGRFFRTVMVEAGASSMVVDRAWITFGSAFGGTRFRVCCLDANGLVMGPTADKRVDVDNNRRDYLEVPSGAVLATIEGNVLGASSEPAAALVTLPKTPAA